MIRAFLLAAILGQAKPPAEVIATPTKACPKCGFEMRCANCDAPKIVGDRIPYGPQPGPPGPRPPFNPDPFNPPGPRPPFMSQPPAAQPPKAVVGDRIPAPSPQPLIHPHRPDPFNPTPIPHPEPQPMPRPPAPYESAPKTGGRVFPNCSCGSDCPYYTQGGQRCYSGCPGTCAGVFSPQPPPRAPTDSASASSADRWITSPQNPSVELYGREDATGRFRYTRWRWKRAPDNVGAP